MGHIHRTLRAIDFEDIACVCGFACIVGGVAWRYDLPLALIVFGMGVMSFGGIALWRKR
jgi:hypothetical protein